MHTQLSKGDLKKLPIGIQTFDKIREGGYIYVDKTKYLIDMIDSGSAYFLSRPRRFGKSLTVSTFNALFRGKKDLFRGLYAEEFFDRPEYRTYPVLKLDMSRITTNKSVESMGISMLFQVIGSAKRCGVELSELSKNSPGDALSELLRSLYEKDGPVVVLIDEYDKPILDCLHKKDKAEEVREALRNFYTQIKAGDASIKFVFITGITKFTKTGVFSTMNNLNDISMDDDYSTMLGYTQCELLQYFNAHIDKTAGKMKLTREELLEQIKNYYDGFSFDGENRLYNPFSTLNFFDKSAFRNFWFESGSPSFLVKYAAEHDLTAEDFRGRLEHEDFTSVTEIELAKPSSFLFQSGYLTVCERNGNLLTLDYPNKEVLSSMSILFMLSQYGNNNAGVISSELNTALAKVNIPLKTDSVTAQNRQ